MAMLMVENVSVALEGLTRLCGVSFALESGDVAAVIGPNGAGKTTLLRALCADAPLSGGRVLFAGRAGRNWKIRDLARRIAVLPQASGLHFPYTVEEVVGLGRLPHSTGLKVDRQIVNHAIAAMDITHLRSRLYPSLSGGEQQRTQLARVMAQIWRPDDAPERLLILDEPTASLDLGHQQQLMQTVRDFASQGVALLLVLHDINLAARFADRLLALNEGRLIASGPSSEVLSADLIYTLFGARVELFKHPHTGQPLVIP